MDVGGCAVGMGVVRMFCVMLVATLPHANLPLQSKSVYIHTDHPVGAAIIKLYLIKATYS